MTSFDAVEMKITKGDVITSKKGISERPKEYIITGEQAEEYAKLYAEANTADFAKMTEVYRVANDFLKQIRSRPVSALQQVPAPGHNPNMGVLFVSTDGFKVCRAGQGTECDLYHHDEFICTIPDEAAAFKIKRYIREAEDSKEHDAAIAAAAIEQERGRIREAQPPMVCLCGSTRFSEAFRQANLTETLAGRIVLSIGCDFKSDDALGLTPDDKCRMDDLHKRKIDLCDEILVLNVGKYIGESTRSEIEYAVNHGKNIRYLEPDEKETEWCIV